MKIHPLPTSTFIIAALFLTTFWSCEKNETLETTDGNEFCPLQFRFYPAIGQLEGCNTIEFIPLYDPVFTTANDGVIIQVPLKKFNAPFVAADPTPNSFETYNLGVHTTNAGSRHQIAFENVEITPGTRVSLYLGVTGVYGLLAPYPVMGNNILDIPANPSLKHKWQIYVQRELSGKYSFAYVADSITHIVKTDIDDFTSADFRMENKDGKSILAGELTHNGATVAVFSTQEDKIPDNLFGAFGFNILESLQDECDIRPMRVKMKNYTYNSINPGERYTDNFSCNTIWF